ncbi:MAG: AI-2E family transporter [Deltaproteobacteria bacterium]|nr:AI-2E family transporter [Deltaproteobacteria bacterium]
MKRPDPAVLRLLIFGGSMIAALVILIVFDSIFMPLLLGLALAYLFDPAVSWFEKKGRSRVTGVIAIALILVLAVTGLVVYIIPAMNDQFEVLRENLPRYTEHLREQAKPLLERLEARFPQAVEEVQRRAVDSLKENFPKLAASIGRRAGRAFSSVLQFVLFLLNLVFVPVFAFYLLVDLPKIKRAASGLIPKPYRELVEERLGEVNSAVASFLRGQLTIALVLATINALGLLILGVPLGLAIGFLAGLANMIPYMALVVGLAPALLLTWAEYQSLPRLLGVIAVFGGAQLLEGTVLSPRILSKSVNLHPVWVLLAIIAGGSLFGFFGMLLAVPVTAAIQVFVGHWLDLYRSSRVYLGPDADQEEPELGS